MTEELAKTILKDWLISDGTLAYFNPRMVCSGTLYNEKGDAVGEGNAIKNTVLTVQQLEALAWWMRNKAT